MNIRKIVLFIFSTVFLLACGGGKKLEPSTIITKKMQVDTYLEKQSVDKKLFWDLKLNGKDVSIRSGEQGAKSETIEKAYVSETVARYETYKLIFNKVQEGFHAPNRIKLEDLLEQKPTSSSNVDSSLYSVLKGEYDQILLIEGDLHIDHLDLDAFHLKVDVLIVKGDLIVDGGIYNANGDYGPALIVKGDVRANYLIAGGSEIYLQGKSYFHNFIFGYYNHGILRISNTTALVYIGDDHSTGLGKNSAITYDYELFNNEEATKRLYTALGKSPGFLEDNEYLDDDEFITALISDKKAPLKMLRKILETNHAYNPQLVQVIKDGLSIQTIKNPSEDIKLAAVKQNGLALKFISNATESVQIAAVINDSDAFKLIKKSSENVQIALVETHPWGLELIDNPNEKVIKRALKNDGAAIEYLKNPSEELQLLAVKNSESAISNALEYIKNPSEKVQLAAVEHIGGAIRYIDNPSDAIKLAAVKQEGSALEYIKNPSYEMQLIAVKKAGWVIEYIKNPTEELIINALKDDADAIKSIKNPSEEAQLIVIKENEYNIGDLKNPTEKIQLIAVSSIGEVIEEIKNPSETVQLAAVRQSPRAIEYIKNPTPKVIQLAKELVTKE